MRNGSYDHTFYQTNALLKENNTVLIPIYVEYSGCEFRQIMYFFDKLTEECDIFALQISITNSHTYVRSSYRI